MAEEANIVCKLGFFLHIPFPPWDIFRLFPWSDEILQGMLGNFNIHNTCIVKNNEHFSNLQSSFFL